MDYQIQYYMKLYVFVVVLMVIQIASAISKYDFNVCRISSCNSEEINCLSDQSSCFNYFAVMRTCFSSCSSSQNYNACWSGCKDNTALANTYYLSLSLCYENMCYLYGSRVVALLVLLVLIFAI